LAAKESGEAFPFYNWVHACGNKKAIQVCQQIQYYQKQDFICNQQN
jgi:hypothetical protein